MKLAIIGVTSLAGGRSIGVLQAPEAFRRFGIAEKLREMELTVEDFGNLKVSPQIKETVVSPRTRNLTAVVSVCKILSKKVEEILKKGFFPLILGGDCSLIIGSITGVVEVFPNVGLIYFDGDADFNTPETTPSGYFDGMSLAHVTGRGVEALTHLTDKYPIIDEGNVVLFGVRNFDEPEIKALTGSAIVSFTVETAARKALRRLERTDGILLHLDVDVMDNKVMPAIDVPSSTNGLTFDEVARALKIFGTEGGLVGILVTEFNAQKNPSRMLTSKVIDLIGITARRVKLARKKA